MSLTSWLWVITKPRCEASRCNRRYSLRVKVTYRPSSCTARDTRSIVSGPVRTTGSLSTVLWQHRINASRRAASSAIPNGLIMWSSAPLRSKRTF
jgi:hypothetical protein